MKKKKNEEEEEQQDAEDEKMVEEEVEPDDEEDKMEEQQEEVLKKKSHEKKKKEKEKKKKKKMKEKEKKKKRKKIQEKEQDGEEEQDEEDEEDEEDDFVEEQEEENVEEKEEVNETEEEDVKEEEDDVNKKPKGTKENYYVDVSILDPATFKNAPRYLQLANGERVVGVDVRHGPTFVCVFCGKSLGGFGTLAHHSSNYCPRIQVLDKDGKPQTKVVKGDVVPKMTTSIDGKFIGTCMDNLGNNDDLQSKPYNALKNAPVILAKWSGKKGNELMAITKVQRKYVPPPTPPPIPPAAAKDNKANILKSI